MLLYFPLDYYYTHIKIAKYTKKSKNVKIKNKIKNVCAKYIISRKKFNNF